jgi:hypothetical protein
MNMIRTSYKLEVRYFELKNNNDMNKILNLRKMWNKKFHSHLLLLTE